MALPQYIPRYTVDEYRSWPGDWELWQGIPVAMSPSADAVHQRIAGRIVRWLGNALDGAGCELCQVYYELDWVVDDSTVLRPDVLVVCGEQPTKFVEAPPQLIVEVLSDSTRDRDLVFKRALYERCGVAFYLTVDPRSGWTQLLQLDEGGRYDDAPHREVQLSSRCRLSLDQLSFF